MAAANTAGAVIAAPSPDICNVGFVWRRALPSDHVCVTPDTCNQTASDNGQAASRTIGDGVTFVGVPARRRDGVQFSDSGHQTGTSEPLFGGSRDHDRDDTGTDPRLRADWSAIRQQGSSRRAQADTALDLGTLWNDDKPYIGYIKDVISVVGSLRPTTAPWPPQSTQRPGFTRSAM